MGSVHAELKAAGLLTLGGPMVGAPGDDLDLLWLLSLSLGLVLACLAGLVKQGIGFAKEGRKANRKKEGVWAFGRLGAIRPPLSCFGFCFWVGRPTMLRTMSDVFVSPPTHRVFPVRLCHSWCWLRGCRSCWFIRSIQAFNNDHKGPLIL